jgi:hypothetical protein
MSGAALALMLPSAAAQAKTVYPKALHGIWMSADDEGRVQCQNYRRAQTQDGTDASEFLVGAQVIRADIWHSYSDYGEGDSYFIQSVTALGRQRWRFATKVATDVLVESGNTGQAGFRVQLANGTLQWVMETVDGKTVDSWDEHLYFRCSLVPAGLYGG